MKLVTADEMRVLEDASEAAGVSRSLLMENAGLQIATAIRHHLAGIAGRRILVLVGPGNNGGDGLVAARHLHRWGGEITAYLAAPRGTDSPHLATATRLGIRIVRVTSDDGLQTLEALALISDLVVDAILGTGRARPLEPPVSDLLTRIKREKLRRSALPIVAVDLPTGLNADSGGIDSSTLPADVTLTLGLPKIGLFTGEGPSVAGDVRTLDIGIPANLDSGLTREIITDSMVRGLLPHRGAAAHKGTHGRALIVAGSRSYIGAAALATTAASRVGAGLVSLAAPASLQAALAPQVPEATHLPLPDDTALGVADETAISALDAATDYDAYLVGCGLGQHPRTAAFLTAAFTGLTLSVGAPLVLDADALNFLAEFPQWWHSIPVPAIITPHPGEMARLMRQSTGEIQASRLELASQAANDWGVTVVLKGAHTVIAAPDGRIRLSPWAVPALATAGTGDVMAGATVGMVAQGLEPFDAATCAVYIHGLAGRMVSDELGDAGLLASDLLPALPRAMRRIRTGDVL